MAEPEIKICQNCKQDFTIESEDLSFYTKIGVPSPKLCPLCRAQRRLAFRNERVFYKRKCDRCDKNVVSMYSPNKPYRVWCYDCWFSEDWDPLIYGRNYDPTRSFLEQFEELWKEVPKVALIHMRSVNSEYLNISADNKNCYMIVESSNNEGCAHCYWIQECKDCVDVSFASKTELSYESDDCYDSYKLFYSKGCHDCRESYFLFDCKDCSDCIGCMNLRSKKYHVFNQPLTKEQYEEFLKTARLNTHEGVEGVRNKFESFMKTQPKKYAEIYNAPGSSGGYMKNSKNCKLCFHCYDSEDSKYGVHVWRNAKDCMDVDTAGRNAERLYNSMNAGIDVSNYVCSNLCWTCSFMQYCYYCFNSNFCFGSVGLRKKEYCILNKKYTKEKFEELQKQIIEDMKKRGEYGEFFPAHMSTFGYNETAAQEQFSLTKEAAEKLGFKWEEYPRGTYGKENIKWESISGTIDPLTAIFACVLCSKNYRIIPAELSFYERLNIPFPRLCPDCRHMRRIKNRGPNRLWKRTCSCGNKNTIYKNNAVHFHGESQCQNEFETNFLPENNEVLYCEQCYNQEVV
ncbi:MAG: hypothetical protein AB1333_03825 [Patescibacteria group bacterium]